MSRTTPISQLPQIPYVQQQQQQQQFVPHPQQQQFPPDGNNRMPGFSMPPQLSHIGDDVDIEDDEATVRETLQYINSSPPPPLHQSTQHQQQHPVLQNSERVIDQQRQQSMDHQQHLNQHQYSAPKENHQYAPYQEVCSPLDEMGWRKITAILLTGGIIFVIASIAPAAGFIQSIGFMRFATDSDYANIAVRTILFCIMFLAALKMLPILEM